MDSPRRGGFSFLLTIAIAAIVGVLAYGWGVQAGQTATAGAAGAVVVYGGPGFGFFGFLLFLLLIGLIFRAFARARYGGPGSYMWGGHGRWHGGPGWGQSRDEAAKAEMPPFVTDWHRRMHEQPDGPDAPKDGPTSGANA